MSPISAPRRAPTRRRRLALLGEIYAAARNLAAGAQRLSRRACSSPTTPRVRQDLRGPAREARLPHHRLQGRFRCRLAARLLRVLRAARAAGKVDFAPFVAVSGAANAAVTAEEAQLCVDGLKHGERYAFVLRQGLPSVRRREPAEVRRLRDLCPRPLAAGALHRPQLRPAAHRPGGHPGRLGQHRRRSTSRSSASATATCCRRCAPRSSSASSARYAAETHRRREGRRRSGPARSTTTSELNHDVVTAFPVLEAVGKLEPGVYVMTARPRTARRAGRRTTTARARRSGSSSPISASPPSRATTACMSSCARSRPPSRSPTSRSGSSPATTRCWRRSRPMPPATSPSIPASRAARAASRRASSSRSIGERLRLPRPRPSRLRPHRPRREGPRRAGRGRRLSSITERGVYRSGETVFVTALLRDAKGAAVAGPAADPRRRSGPTASNTAAPWSRTRASAGAPSRCRSCPAPCAAPGASRPTPTRRAPPVGEASFLVEDYVPERLELTLTPKTPALAARRAGRDRRSRRAISTARPGAELDVSGEVVVQAGADERHQGPRRLHRRPRRRDGRGRRPPRSRSSGTTDAQGPRRHVRCRSQELAAPRPLEAQDRPARRRDRAAAPSSAASRCRSCRRARSSACARTSAAISPRARPRPSTSSSRAPDGTRLARQGVELDALRVERRYQWFNSRRPLGLRARANRRAASPTGASTLAADAPARIATPVEWGTYRLDVRAPDLGETAQTSVTFTVGWSGDQTAETPDLLDMALDKASYAPGDEHAASGCRRASPARRRSPSSATRCTTSRVVDVAADGTTRDASR